MISANLVTRSHSSSLFLPPTHPSWIAFPRVMASVFIFSLSKTYRFKCLQELRGLCKLEWMHCSKAQDQPHRAYLQMDPASMQPVRDQPTYSVPCPLPKWHLFLTKSLLPDFPPPPRDSWVHLQKLFYVSPLRSYRNSDLILSWSKRSCSSSLSSTWQKFTTRNNLQSLFSASLSQWVVCSFFLALESNM